MTIKELNGEIIGFVLQWYTGFSDSLIAPDIATLRSLFLPEKKLINL